jgi:hypothetical protein
MSTNWTEEIQIIIAFSNKVNLSSLVYRLNAEGMKREYINTQKDKILQCCQNPK